MPGVLTHSPSDIVRQLLVNLNLGVDSTTDTTSDWPIYESREPDLPDDCITIYNTADKLQGRTQNDGETQGQEGIQIRVRSTDPVNGQLKARSILVAIDTQVLQSVVNLEGRSYRIPALNRTTGVLSLFKEVPTTKRNLYTINATAAIRQLS